MSLKIQVFWAVALCQVVKRSLTLKIKALQFFETSVIAYQSTWSSISEGFNLHLNKWVTKSLLVKAINVQLDKKLIICKTEDLLSCFVQPKEGPYSEPF